ncbi:MAG: hypothetical protein AAFU80_11360 [Pseudomonadota bacterium]
MIEKLTFGRVTAIVLSLTGAGAAWWGWSELGQLRRTVFFEFRFVLWLTGTFLGLSILQWIAARLDRDKH